MLSLYNLLILFTTENFRIQLQANKHEAQQRIHELNEKFQQQETELNDVRKKFAAYREEMADTEIRIESLTLDLEIAEEKVIPFEVHLLHSSNSVGS